MTTGCRRVPRWLEEDRESRLDGVGRRRLAAHLESCPPCRRFAAETAPLPLFGDLIRQPLPDGVEAFILGGLRASRQRRPWPVMPRWMALRMEAAPAVAAIFLVGLLLVFWIGQAGPPPGVGAGVGPEEGMHVEIRRPPLAPHVMSNAVSTVQNIRSSTAEIYAFSLPGQTGSTEVIFIVDRSMDL